MNMNTQTESTIPQQEATSVGAATVQSSASKKMIWTAGMLTALPALLLIFSAIMKLARPPAVIEGFVKLGIPERLALGIGILELACTILYLIPRTAVLGAILLTGYLGGAIITHLRMGEPWIMVVVIGVLVWGGIFLRDARLRALIPLRK
jgi:hypothetical protein